MTGKTSIEWTDHSWNPATGCTRISNGCDLCYAFTLHDMRHEVYLRDGGIYPNGNPMPKQYAKPFSEVQLLPERLEDPLHMKTPRKIFVNSMSDWCHKDIPDAFVLDMFRTMLRADWHIYQLLTKRAPRMVYLSELITSLIYEVTGSTAWPAHIWCGVSVESGVQRGRIAHLCKVPSQVRFISYEPALGPLGDVDLTSINWLICGAESGRGARPMDDDWARGARDLCLRDGVSFFFKQKADKSGHKISLPTLDGEVWNQFPEVSHARSS